MFVPEAGDPQLDLKVGFSWFWKITLVKLGYGSTNLCTVAIILLICVKMASDIFATVGKMRLIFDFDGSSQGFPCCS
jgi:hypothetical protein